MSTTQQKLRARRVFVNPIYKDRVTVLKSCEETGGVYSLGQLEVSPGGGNNLHIHGNITETFTAVKGVLGVRCRDEKIFLQPGESFTIHPRTPHHFFNPGDETIVCNVKLQPGNDGFEKGIAIGYGLAADGKTNKKGVPGFMHLSMLLVLTDTRPANALRFLMPIFKWFAKRAKKKGIEDELLKKYYYMPASHR